MRILIVDDEIKAVRDLELSLREVVPSAEIGTATKADTALEMFAEREFDVAFLDVNMPVKDGMTIAKEMIKLRPKINIIMVTAYPQYALDAVKLYVCDYIVKPALPEDLSRALEHLRYPVPEENHERLYVRCFGSFEVFYDGEPVHFNRAKVKELFAYLIDRNGSTATNAEIRAVLWQDKASDEEKQQKYFALIVHELRSWLEELGLSDIFLQSRNAYAIVPDKINCDYFAALIKNEIEGYKGEYMTQYNWAAHHFKLL